MRPAISTDETTGSSRWQADDEVNDELAHDISFTESLECERHHYERSDIKKAPVMAEVSWADARPMCDKLKDASDFAIFLELNRRGYAIAGNVLKQE
jgi:hypothetical protein